MDTSSFPIFANTKSILHASSSAPDISTSSYSDRDTIQITRRPNDTFDASISHLCNKDVLENIFPPPSQSPTISNRKSESRKNCICESVLQMRNIPSKERANSLGARSITDSLLSPMSSGDYDSGLSVCSSTSSTVDRNSRNWKKPLPPICEEVKSEHVSNFQKNGECKTVAGEASRFEQMEQVRNIAINIL